MDKVASLLADRFNDLWMAMPCIRHTDTAGEIQEFASIVSVDVGSFGPICNKVEDAR
jgi:hypothetical protein